MVKRLYTIGEIARQLGVNVHNVRYAIEQRRIQPAAVAGIVFVYSDESFAAIKAELSRPGRGRGRRFRSEQVLVAC